MLCFGVGLYVLVTNRYLKLCGIFKLPLRPPPLTKSLFYCNKTNVAASLPCLWKVVARLLRRFLQQLNLTSFTIINISLTSTTVPNDFQHAAAQTLLAKKKKKVLVQQFLLILDLFSPPFQFLSLGEYRRALCSSHCFSLLIYCLLALFFINHDLSFFMLTTAKFIFLSSSTGHPLLNLF